MTGSVTISGSLHGTITFLPPECILSNKHTSYKSDIWSLGITLLEFLTLGIAWEDVFSEESEESELEKQMCHGSPQTSISLPKAFH